MKLIFVQLHSHCSKYNFKFYKFSSSLNIFLKTFCENLNPKKFLGTTFPGSDAFSTSVGIIVDYSRDYTAVNGV